MLQRERPPSLQNLSVDCEGAGDFDSWARLASWGLCELCGRLRFRCPEDDSSKWRVQEHFRGGCDRRTFDFEPIIAPAAKKLLAYVTPQADDFPALTQANQLSIVDFRVVWETKRGQGKCRGQEEKKCRAMLLVE